jgi:hypothetical protein
MRQNIIKKPNDNILIEWTFDTNNVIQTGFGVFVDTRDGTRSYFSNEIGLNIKDNQLFRLDGVTSKWTNINPTRYPFLQIEEWDPTPIRHDRLTIYLPSNWNFDDKFGFLIKVKSLDFSNRDFIELSNFYFDRLDSTRAGDIQFINPPLVYGGKIWDRTITVDVPSVSGLSQQISSGNVPIPNSPNDRISGGSGFSVSSPILVELFFINSISQIGSLKTWTLDGGITIDFPQSPQLTELGLVIKESQLGDYFEIYPVYNGSLEQFESWVDKSRGIDKLYFYEIIITQYESGIGSRPIRFLIDGDFSKITEWRPVVRPSSTLVSISVDLIITEKNSGDVIIRKAIYGMTPNQISKYTTNPKSTLVLGANKSRILTKIVQVEPEIDMTSRNKLQSIDYEIMKPNLFNIGGVVCYSPNDLLGDSDNLDKWREMGFLKISISPFDDIIKFNVSIRESGNTIKPLDMTLYQSIKISFKSDFTNLEFDLMESNLVSGGLIFRISGQSYNELKNSWVNGSRFFYITTTNSDKTTLIYSGLFIPSEFIEISKSNPNLIESESSIIVDPNERLETAIARRVN